MYENKISCFVRSLMLLGFQIILFLGMLNKFLFHPKFARNYKHYKQKFKGLFTVFDEIYFYYVYRRICDCSHVPIRSSGGVKITLTDRISSDFNWTFRFTGKISECINFGSFNYLGLLEINKEHYNRIANVIDINGVIASSSSTKIGQTPLHKQLEKLTSEFLGVEDTIICGAGFATNSLSLSSLLDTDCLVFSDEKNHASIILGLRLSNSKICKFAHNDMEDLQKKILKNLKENHRNGGLLFSKIFIVCEGLYSVDGTIINLPKMLEIKKKYKAYLFIDDAHGVGILGPHGRGIFDYYNMNSDEIDIIMGTYSKAFASNGGYIAGKKILIDFLKKNSAISYGSPMPPVVVKQSIISIQTLMSNNNSVEGNLLVNKLHENVHYLRGKLKQLRINIIGHENSPIIPWILGSVSMVIFVLRELKNRGIAVAGVIYPATPIQSARIRINVSAAHTIEDLDKIACAINDLVQTGLLG